MRPEHVRGDEMASVAGEQETASFSIGAAMSDTIAMVRAAPALFFGTSFLLGALPALLLRWFLASAATVATGAPILLAIVVYVLWMLCYMAAQAVLLRATVDRLDGAHQPLGATVRAALPAVLPLVAVSLIYWFAVSLGLVALIVPGVFVALIWSVAAPAVVAEGSGPIAALSRSRALTRGARGQIAGLFLLVIAIYAVAYALAGVVNVLVLGLPAVDTGQGVAGALTSVVLQVVLLPLWIAIQGVVYVALREAKHGPAGERLADIFA